MSGFVPAIDSDSETVVGNTNVKTDSTLSTVNNDKSVTDSSIGDVDAKGSSLKTELGVHSNSMEATKNDIKMDVSNSKLSTLESRLQMLEKRLKGSVNQAEESEQINSAEHSTDFPKPLNIIKAFGVNDSSQVNSNDKIISDAPKDDNLDSVQENSNDKNDTEPIDNSNVETVKPNIDHDSNSQITESAISSDADVESDSKAGSKSSDQPVEEGSNDLSKDTCSLTNDSNSDLKLNSNVMDDEKPQCKDDVASPMSVDESSNKKVDESVEEMDVTSPCSKDNENADDSDSKSAQLSKHIESQDDNSDTEVKESIDNEKSKIEADKTSVKDDDLSDVSHDEAENDEGKVDSKTEDNSDDVKSDADENVAVEMSDKKSEDADDEELKNDSKDGKDAEASKKGRGIDAIASMLRKQQGAGEPKSDSEENSKTAEEANEKTEKSEMKGYLKDAMNEILGMYGYNENGTPKTVPDTEDTEKESKIKEESVAPTEKQEDKPKSSPSSSSSSSKRMKMCEECKVVKTCKYQVMMQGTDKFIRTMICDDTCYKVFREKQQQQKLLGKRVTRSLTKEACHICQKDMKNVPSYLPGSGTNKLNLCSEACFKRHQQQEAPKRQCAQCKKPIEGRLKSLTWETMEYCSEECLGSYQNYLGSHCACCNNSVQNSSLGKFCVRFGSDIKQFCSSTCLDDFKKGLKVCTFCQKDISDGFDGFLAPVGDKGQFKDFCSQQCMEKYDVVNNPANSTPKMGHCAVCNKLRNVKMELLHDGSNEVLCSETCYAAFKFSNKITQHKCDHCHKFFDTPEEENDQNQFTVQIDGTGKRFCSKMCLNLFVLSNRKIVPCSWCKVKKYNFDMIERVDSLNQVQLFCSLNCLSLFRVNLKASSSRNIKCDFCSKSAPAQFHLTMSDASVRNFCTYNCVTKFQNQFPNLVQKNIQTAAGSIVRKVSTKDSTAPTPVISSVMSLAPKPKTPAVTYARQVSSTSSPATSNSISKPSTTRQQSPTSNTSKTQTLTQQVIIKPPPPKLMKNKGTLCKPITLTKGVSCKPHPCYKNTQTDAAFMEEDGVKPKIISIPIPIYVPLPMHMYSMPTPVPVPFPVPIPVPIFIPTTKGTYDEILKTIKEIREKIPDNPLEADLLMMAELAAENMSNPNRKFSQPLNVSNVVVPETAIEPEMNQPQYTNENMLQIALKSALAPNEDIETFDVEAVLEASATSRIDTDYQPNDDYSSDGENKINKSNKRSNGNPRRSGRKRLKKTYSADFVEDNPTSESDADDSNEFSQYQIEAGNTLKYMYGVNAWRHWVLQKNHQLEKASSNRKLKLFKTDLLQLTSDELNYSLCLFVKEVRKPNGEEYSADSIYYLCLGIQQYLFLNDRIDNILTDASFEKFTECLNDALFSYESRMLRSGKFMARIDSEVLWESRQLGAHSPHVLLNSLLYFNTKYFGLRTVEDHMRMSFSHVVKNWKKVGRSLNAPSNIFLKYYPPSSTQQQLPGVKRKKEELLEQAENIDNPLRCPVKLYEFYLSKCPESIKSRSDVYYLYPERSCVPDSPVWYSTQPLGREQLTKMLQRVKMVKGVFDS